MVLELKKQITYFILRHEIMRTGDHRGYEALEFKGNYTTALIFFF